MKPVLYKYQREEWSTPEINLRSIHTSFPHHTLRSKIQGVCHVLGGGIALSSYTNIYGQWHCIIFIILNVVRVSVYTETYLYMLGLLDKEKPTYIYIYIYYFSDKRDTYSMLVRTLFL